MRMAIAAVHAVDQRVLKEVREPRAHGCALYRLVQLLPDHKAHKMSPAMAGGVTDTLRDVAWIAGLVEATAPKPGPRGPVQDVCRIARNLMRDARVF
jgi:hypothetical protein